VPTNRHAYGGTRIGPDDTTAVGDHYGLSFESRNLVGLGGSPVLGSSDHHPTETIEALA
jgi:hypothetical protein